MQVRALVVVPSYELAVQVQKVFDQLTHGTRVHVGVVCGSVSLEKERAMLSDSVTYPPCSCVDIVIATPGRLVEHLDMYVSLVHFTRQYVLMLVLCFQI